MKKIKKIGGKKNSMGEEKQEKRKKNMEIRKHNIG